MRLKYPLLYLLVGVSVAMATGCMGGIARPESLDGEVATTNSPVVASYSVAVPQGGALVAVEFGTDTNYGRSTSAKLVPPDGSNVNILVAGMKADTLYHMRAVAQLPDGTQIVDSDHTFMTGKLTVNQAPVVTTTTAAGATPQSGIELFDLVGHTDSPAVATDLDGSVIWSYTSNLPLQINPIKLLDNGDFLLNISDARNDGLNSVLREIDLAGNTIWEMTAGDLNAALAKATCAGCNITVVGMHHDFVTLPNGHIVVLGAVDKVISGVTVVGDVVIDLDENHKPVWLWNAFDHLDVNRHPMFFPDWLHSNAILYSPDDGNLLVSMRHQNWIVKIHYANGTGAGEVMWKLGYQGDFTLVGGTDPTDWFYAQHGPSFLSSTTAGKFTLGVFDNGDDRTFASGVTCGSAGAPPCFYSSAAVLEIDESAMTATYVFHQTTPEYSNFGGNLESVANGNIHFCETDGGPGFSADVYEITPSGSTVWKAVVSNQFAYRAKRLPSLYPGVQW